MKQLKYLLTIPASILLLTSCHNNSFKVEGTVEGLHDGDTLVVLNASGEAIDTMLVNDGSFTWSGEADSVGLYTISILGTPMGVMVFNEPGTIQANISTDGRSSVAGTAANNALQQMNVLSADFEEQMFKIYSDMYSDSVTEEQQMALMKKYQDLQSDFQNTFKQKAVSNLDNEFGYFMLTQLASSDMFSAEELKDAIKQMPAHFQERQAVKNILEKLEVKFSTNVGDTVPEFMLQTPDGQTVNVLNEIKCHKLTILDFWASWCQPCCEEMPFMKHLLSAYEDKGLAIIGISLDEIKENWTSRIAELQLPWLQVSDLQGWSSNIGGSFGVEAIPFTVVINQDGIILAKGLRGEELAQFIAEHMQ